ncbi:flagellar basal body-associated FliL family protein [Thioclava nitratireducens]|uniref:flagellar basal body-associated FliL family protein n=1 Tax=Thioclava nitratireducens TaxID=1915078 RepID=UPI0024819358|nr:flagellar basal body-associated FliL family protein [Thioclava nitratireducens]WGT51728.1 flagellar basal body-associated FliL family protein [Thioclava nitratireducens]
MTDAAVDGEELAEAPAGRWRVLRDHKRLVMAAGALAVVAMFCGGFVAFGGVSALTGGKPAESAGHGGTGAGAAAGGDALLDFDDIVVNITGTTADGASAARYLKIHLALVYPESPDAEAAMAEKKPFIRDTFTGFLRQMTVEDLRGSIGLIKLKAELLKRARAVVGDNTPSEVLISDLVVQ